MSLRDPDNPLAVEIQQEMAGTYFAACRKMIDSLEALKACDRHASPVLAGDHAAHRMELLDDAAERVHFALIQREAMKLSDHAEFLDDYKVPHEVRTRLGVRRRASRGV